MSADRYAYVNNLLALKSAAGTLSTQDFEFINRWLVNPNKEVYSNDYYQYQSGETPPPLNTHTTKKPSKKKHHKKKHHHHIEAQVTKKGNAIPAKTYSMAKHAKKKVVV